MHSNSSVLLVSPSLLSSSLPISLSAAAVATAASTAAEVAVEAGAAAVVVVEEVEATRLAGACVVLFLYLDYKIKERRLINI